MSVPILATTIKGAAIAQGLTTTGSVISGVGHGIFTGDWSRLENAGKIALGNFYLDENRSFFGGVLQALAGRLGNYHKTRLDILIHR